MSAHRPQLAPCLRAGLDPDAGRSPPPTPPWARHSLSPKPLRAVLGASAEAPPLDDRRRKSLAAGLALAAVMVVTVCVAPYGAAAPQSAAALRSEARAAPTGDVATVLVIRHCDKDEKSGNDCDARGFRRAHWLPGLFGDGNRFAAPRFVFARRPEGKRRVMRSVEMVSPLAETFGLPIDESYGVATEKDLAAKVRSLVTGGDLDDGLAVIAWKHEQIPQLAYDLGWHDKSKERTTWRADDYDTIFELTYTRFSDGAWRCAGARSREGFADADQRRP